jgi:hypothetical protein
MESAELMNIMFLLNQSNKTFLHILIMFIFMHFKYLKKYIFGYIYLPFISDKNLTYKLTGNYSYRNNVIYMYDFSHQLMAVLHDLIIRLAQDNSQNYTVQEVYIGGLQKEIIKFVYFNKKNYYDVNDCIKLCTKSKENLTIKEDGKNVSYEIILCSKLKNMRDIYDYIENCIQVYDEHVKNQLKNQYTFIFNGIQKNEGLNKTLKLEYQEYPFVSTKTFDNMFFERKQELIKRIDYFNDNKQIYQRLGIPYTFGMLFHGPPGCGKTSAIKAIANYTKRHVIILPVKKIKSIETLKEIFLSSFVNSYYIPNDKRLYVFEEMDCGQWKNVVMNRTIQQEEIVPQVIVYNENKEKKLNLVEEVTINLGEFLELLDGIIEISGRMLILSSNRPEILDPALLRPGRVDFNIEFNKMSREDVKNMYYLWFDEHLPKYIYESMKDYTFSQAEISVIFSKSCKKDIHYALREATLKVDLH